MRTHERVHASKTWKRRRFEPDDGVSSLESIEGKKSTEDDVTEPPKKRRRTRKTGKSKRARSQVDDMVVDDSLSVSKEETTQPDDGVITTSPAREESREDGDFQETAAVTSAASRRRLYRMRKITPQPEWSDSENQAVVPRKRRFRSHSKRIKKIKRSRRTKTSTSPSTTTNREQSARLRQQCLNIRTFARQFGTNDISEFTQEHCAFIENYYPELTCEKRNEYVAECKRYL
ncbi:unnamed protein product [Nippostrongylus brasiliensis]|uniref:SAP30_Sin3_bdg domain-containing protein n=1 Tax=Nippostrongylus brasiliensis TaxID=27835 RepID=A0A0N4YG26_NIPBR|nr:unnamed protein product [Nippostrongylus brasiliensis]